MIDVRGDFSTVPVRIHPCLHSAAISEEVYTIKS
jgi:hypothetical protein